MLRAPTAQEPSLTVAVRNTGKRAGDAVPMLFLRRTRGIAVARVRQLAAFSRIHLAPGEEGELTLRIGEESFLQCDENGRERAVPGRFSWYLWEGTEDRASGEFTI